MQQLMQFVLHHLYLKDQIKSKYEDNIRVTSEYGGGVEVADVGMPSNVRSAKSGGAICAVENKFIVYLYSCDPGLKCNSMMPYRDVISERLNDESTINQICCSVFTYKKALDNIINNNV